MKKTASAQTSDKYIIEQAWDSKIEWNKITEDAVTRTLVSLGSGNLRIAEKLGSHWKINDWIKKAILLSFRHNPAKTIKGSPVNSNWFDKIDSKFSNWSDNEFTQADFRAVPGCFVRHGAYIGKNVVLMPSFVNIGAYVGNGTMIDTWATVGSCAQIGNNCHISGGVGIAGVLEPLQASPVIIEDNCFIGARSEIAEGVIVEEGAVISMGVYIGQSTKIIDRETGNISYGRIPAFSVVVPGSIPDKNGKLSLYAAIIVKKVDSKTRSKTSINELLRGDN